MECEQVHWHAGQGERERRGGEEGLGLGQADPDGETWRGETGRERGATHDSLLGE